MSTKEKWAEIAGGISATNRLRAIEADDFVRRLFARIAALERQLAESYAPCKVCGWPPLRRYDFASNEAVMYCDCKHVAEARGADLGDAHAAWNKAQRGE